MIRKVRCAHLAAQQQLELQEVHLAKHQRALHAPLPNLFRATFEQAQRLSPGEQWLQQRVEAFDAGGPQQRKQVLEDFLDYVGHSSTSGMEELFSNQAHLFFIRLATWFSVTLPTLFELPLQLKVFLTFLEFREQSFVKAFFESGVVVPLMQSLSDDDFDIPDEVRCLVLLVLHKLAANGRHHKELLCAKGVVGSVLACTSDALRWETLKCAGRLLCELFISNPRHQPEVLDALQELMTKKVALTQRVGAQAIVSLLVGEQDALSPLLCDSSRHRTLVNLGLQLLESKDLRVSADAYCLLYWLVRLFNCDEFLFDFARAQLRTDDIESEWVRLELESQEVHSSSADDPPMGGRHHGTVVSLHHRVAKAVALAGGPPLQDAADGQEFVRRVESCNSQFREEFRAEAGHILKWSLLMDLARRNAAFCTELVEGGLAETLLMSLLDLKHPVRQAAALSELHRLRLLSPAAERTVASVLGNEELLRAVSLDQFAAVARPTALAKARYRLRNLQLHGRCEAFSAKEHALHQELLEKRMADTYGIRLGLPASAFLTEPEAADEAGRDAPEEAVPRSGPSVYDVKRVPRSLEGAEGPPGSGRRPATGPLYAVDRGEMEELATSGPSCFLADPLDSLADEESPLMQEIMKIESYIGLGAPRRGPAAPALSRRGRCGEPRASHRLSLQHRRALALRPMPPPGVEPRRPTARSARTIAPSRASSEFTDVSLRCGGYDLSTEWPEAALPAGERQAPEALAPLSAYCATCGGAPRAGCAHGHHHPHQHRAAEQASAAKLPLLAPRQLVTSLAETSVGPEATISDDLSRELPSLSYQDPLPVEDSRLTLATSSVQAPASHHFSSVDLLEEEEEEPEREEQPRGQEKRRLADPLLAPQLVERTALAAVVEFPREDYTATRPQRRVVQVASPPFHECVAFDRHEIETDRQRLLKQVGGIVDPVTQKRFRELRAAGPFPRRGVGAAVPFRPLRAQSASPRGPVLASGVELGHGWKPLASAPAEAAAAALAVPLSARLPRAGGDEAEPSLESVQAGSATFMEAGRKAPRRSQALRRGTTSHLLPAEEPREAPQGPTASGAEASMKLYFPASAKAHAA